MTPDLYQMLAGWLENGTDQQKAHAINRLSLPDAIDYKPSEYPSLIQQARNVIVAAGQFVASGFATVDEEEQERRLAICYQCEFWDGGQGRCRKCGCFGSFKAWVATQHCPIDKW